MLAGKYALVTGGGGGIGKAVVQRFVEEGVAGVCIAEINEVDGKEVASAMNALAWKLRQDRSGETEGVGKVDNTKDMVIFVKTDAGDELSVKACVDAAVQHFGTLHILVNNAVRFEFGHLLPEGSDATSKSGTDKRVTTEAWERVMRINVQGYANFMKYACEVMAKNDLSGTVYENQQKRGTHTIDARDRGSIVNVASVSAYIAQPEFVPYNASKGAVLQMSRCCAMDFAKVKVRVNVVSPGTIQTEGSFAHMDLCGFKGGIQEGIENFGNYALLKRQAAPEEVANSVCFLASDLSSYMTGSNMIVDGGSTI